MKCLIIDDEPLAREGIELMLREIPFMQLCGSFSNIMDADFYLMKRPADLIFLDIQMPQMSGIDYLQTKSRLPQIIITTAYPQYALDGYELDVTDYLVKPIRFDRFYKAVNKALKKRQLQVPPVARDTIEVEDSCVFVRSDKKFIRVSLTNVCYIEGMKDYSVLHLSQEKIIVSINLRTMQAQLPLSYFMRISKSFIINLMQIKYIDNDFAYVCGKQIPIGEGYKNDLIEYVKRTGIIQR